MQIQEPVTREYQVPKVEYETRVVEPERTIQVPKMVMVPQTTYEYQQVMKEHTIQVPRPVYKTQKRTIQVPKMVTETKEIDEQVLDYETKTQTVQVPRTIMEPQVVTSYQQQMTQEPVTVQVPMTQTQMVAQQINKVIEYQRQPVNTYTVAGGYYPVGQPQLAAGAATGVTGGYTLPTAGASSFPGQAFGGQVFAPQPGYGGLQFGNFGY